MSEFTVTAEKMLGRVRYVVRQNGIRRYSCNTKAEAQRFINEQKHSKPNR